MRVWLRVTSASDEYQNSLMNRKWSIYLCFHNKYWPIAYVLPLQTTIGRYKLTTTTINRPKCKECTNVYTLCRTVASTYKLAMRIIFVSTDLMSSFYFLQSSMEIETKTKTRFCVCIYCIFKLIIHSEFQPIIIWEKRLGTRCDFVSYLFRWICGQQ